ncbi:MAG: sulfurtransferase [Parvularculaceae bacterium]|nr:sulfurtransferase [Parvularculaceae bacterium]
MTDRIDDFPYPLISTGELGDRIESGRIRIIDASWRMPDAGHALDDHRKRRIPGAVFFDLDEIADKSQSLPHMLASQDAFAKAVGAMGIASDDKVVIYDDAGLFSAPRVWWTFRAMGHDAVSVLDGGLGKWTSEGRPVDAGLAAPAPVQYRCNAARAISRTSGDVRALLSAKSGAVIDARPAPRFLGRAAEPRAGLRSGAMPGALNLPHALLVSQSGELAPPEAIKRLFDEAGLRGGEEVITSCGSGVTAAVLFLALERIGRSDVGLYDGSWAEWGKEENDSALFPVAAG